MVVTVKGQTRRLTGTAEAQYEQWRRLLHEIYEAETGLADEIPGTSRLATTTAVTRSHAHRSRVTALT